MRRKCHKVFANVDQSVDNDLSTTKNEPCMHSGLIYNKLVHCAETIYLHRLAVQSAERYYLGRDVLL